MTEDKGFQVKTESNPKVILLLNLLIEALNEHPNATAIGGDFQDNRTGQWYKLVFEKVSEP